MNKLFQVTLLSKGGKYKPVSAIVRVKENEVNDKLAIRKKGIIKICQTRLWTNRELKEYEYTICKLREYNKEKIEQENKERYEKIKEENYQSGKWKRPSK